MAPNDNTIAREIFYTMELCEPAKWFPKKQGDQVRKRIANYRYRNPQITKRFESRVRGDMMYIKRIL